MSEKEKICKMYAKLDKVATWLEKNARLRESHAKASSRFPSLADEYLAEARNWQATAKDIRQLLSELGPQGKDGKPE